MKNILWIHPWAGRGGAESVLLQLISAVDHNRYQSTVLVFGRGSLLDELDRLKIPYVQKQAPRWSRPWTVIRTVVEICLLIVHRQIDFVFSNGTWSHLLGGLSAALTRRPSAWYQHARTDRTWISRLALKIPSSRIFANSKFTQTSLLKALGHIHPPVVLAYPALDPQYWAQSTPNPVRPPDPVALARDGFKILLPARLEPNKGITVALYALEYLLKKSDPIGLPITLWLAGAPVVPEYAEALKQKVRSLGIESSVHFLGEITDMRPLYQSADVVISPSIQPETFGLVLAEALLSDRPVIATNHGGALEIITDSVTGLTVPPGDSLALAHAITRVMTHRDWTKTLVAQGKAHVAAQFTMSVLSNVIQSSLDQTLSDRRRSKAAA